MSDDFGSHLKHQRELRGISLDEIASATKIHIRYLKALEENTFDDLPGEVFIKGFIRSYGRAIGANLQELIAAYDETVGRERLEVREKTEQETNTETKKQLFLGNLLVGGFLGLFILFAIWYLLQRPPQEEAVKTSTQQSTSSRSGSKKTTPPVSGTELTDPQKASSSSVLTDASRDKKEAEPVTKNKTSTADENQKPAEKNKKTETAGTQNSETEKPKPDSAGGTSQKPVAEKENGAIINNQKAQQVQEDSAESPASSEAEAKLRLVIKVSENAWFNLAIDGAGERDFILPSGETKEFTAQEELLVTIGNRRGTRLTLNGKKLALPSTPDNVVRNLRVNLNLIE